MVTCRHMSWSHVDMCHEVMSSDDTCHDVRPSHAGSGTVDLMEFIQLMAKKFVEEDLERDIRIAFRIFDRDGSGKINARELRDVMIMNLGEEHVEDEDVDEILRQADVNKDGLIDYEGKPPTFCSRHVTDKRRDELP